MKSAWLQTDDPRWHAALRGISHDVYHLPEYCRLAAEDEGGEAVAFWAEDAGDQLLVPMLERSLPALVDPGRRYSDGASPYGYPGPVMSDGADAEAMLQCLVSSAAERGMVTAFLRLHPLLPCDWLQATDPGQGIRVEHGQTVSINLKQNEADQWSEVRSRIRSQIRRLGREGFRVHWNDWGRYGEFLSIYEQTMKQVGASDRYFFGADYFYGLKAALGDRLHLAVVDAPGPGAEMAAAAIFTEEDGIVQYHLGGTADHWRSAGPSRLLFDSARRFFGAESGRGNRALHLGGGLGGGEDSLFRFKAGFSRQRAGFATLRIVLDADANERLETTWQKRFAPATFDDDFFPRYRQQPTSVSQPGDIDARPVCS